MTPNGDTVFNLNWDHNVLDGTWSTAKQKWGSKTNKSRQKAGRGNLTLNTVHTISPLGTNSTSTDLHNHPWSTYGTNWSGPYQSTHGGGGSSVRQ